jgi:hypothetical protein
MKCGPVLDANADATGKQKLSAETHVSALLIRPNVQNYLHEVKPADRLPGYL